MLGSNGNGQNLQGKHSHHSQTNRSDISHGISQMKYREAKDENGGMQKIRKNGEIVRKGQDTPYRHGSL
jgi:hypothetical protein